MLHLKLEQWEATEIINWKILNIPQFGTHQKKEEILLKITSIEHNNQN
jgi:hypothetical protein